MSDSSHAPTLEQRARAFLVEFYRSEGREDMAATVEYGEGYGLVRALCGFAEQERLAKPAPYSPYVDGKFVP